MVLALALSLAQVVAPTSEAASSKKFVMFTKEKSKYYIGSLVKSVKSSKPSVVKIKKSGSYLNLTAKKKGKATITIKSKYGSTTKWVITVNPFKYKLTFKGVSTSGYSAYAYYEFINKSSEYISSISFTYDILDAAGNVLRTKDDMYAYSLVPNAKVYLDLYIPSDLSTADSISVKSYKISHTINSGIKSQTKNITATYNKDTDQVTFKNKSKTNVTAKADVVFYDASGKIIGVNEASAYLTSKGKDTKSLYVTNNVKENYASYKIFPRAYS